LNAATLRASRATRALVSNGRSEVDATGAGAAVMTAVTAAAIVAAGALNAAADMAITGDTSAADTRRNAARN
jgi:hypothetical protein